MPDADDKQSGIRRTALLLTVNHASPLKIAPSKTATRWKATLLKLASPWKVARVKRT